MRYRKLTFIHQHRSFFHCLLTKVKALFLLFLPPSLPGQSVGGALSSAKTAMSSWLSTFTSSTPQSLPEPPGGKPWAPQAAGAPWVWRVPCPCAAPRLLSISHRRSAGDHTSHCLHGWSRSPSVWTDVAGCWKDAITATAGMALQVGVWIDSFYFRLSLTQTRRVPANGISRFDRVHLFTLGKFLRMYILFCFTIWIVGWSL